MRLMSKYSLVPGPTTILPEVLNIHQENFGSSDLEPEFWDDYIALENSLQTILNTKNDIAILSGEGMVALWGAMKSVIRPGDLVVSVINGLYGDGFAVIAQNLGATVKRIEFPWDQPVNNTLVCDIITKERPKLVTMVHCETPTGVLNALSGIGQATRRSGGLLLVDFVSSAGGVELHVDEEMIDLGLLGAQKVLSAPPSLSFVTLSPRAWQAIKSTDYQGYDSLLPFYGVKESHYLPYTHNWHAIAATAKACGNIIAEGVHNVWKRHLEVQSVCLKYAEEIGLSLYSQAAPSPTVTALRIPCNLTWESLNRGLRERGVIVGGCYGDLSGKVFRIGHMGTQANAQMIAESMAILSEVIKDLSNSAS